MLMIHPDSYEGRQIYYNVRHLATEGDKDKALRLYRIALDSGVVHPIQTRLPQDDSAVHTDGLAYRAAWMSMRRSRVYRSRWQTGVMRCG